MATETLIAFVLATALAVAAPGPTVLLVTGTAFAYGTRFALAFILGAVLANVILIALTFAGVAEMLRAFPSLAAIIKLAGGFFLAYLGWGLWRAVPQGGPASSGAAADFSLTALGTQGFLVTIVNPKTALFFVTFLPQFLDASTRLLPQMIFLGFAFLAVGVPILVLYALLGGGPLRRCLSDPKWVRRMNRVSGGSLIVLGAAAVVLAFT